MLEVLVTDIEVLVTDIEMFVIGRLLEGQNSCKGRNSFLKKNLKVLEKAQHLPR